MLSVLLILIIFPHFKMKIEEFNFDIFNKNNYVSTVEEVDGILATFKVISKSNLPSEFKKRTLISKKEYYQLSPNVYYIISKRDLYKRIAGNNRIIDLFSVDNEVVGKSYWSTDKLYWGIKKEIIYELIAFIKLLGDEGYDKNGFWIRDGYRHPQLNENVNGAKRSRHIYGDALDIIIEDINGDGKSNFEDKNIALSICEKQLIKNKGGVGRYPKTQVIHIDLRGNRARWNSN